jgi:tetratricopeptide (TPR) repeat protein
MTLAETEESLLDKAREEERKYNWIEAAALYEKVVKFYLEKNLVEKAANCYKNLGYAHFRSADTIETAEDYLKQLKCAIKAYKEANKLFKQLGNRSVEFECEAEIFSINGILATSEVEGQKAFLHAIKLLSESSEIYSKESDKESFARVMCRIASTSYFLMNYNINQDEYNQVIQQGSECADKAWEISEKIGNIQLMSESLNMRLMINFMGWSVKDFKKNENLREGAKNFLVECNKTIAIIEKVDDPYALSLVYFATGICYCYTGYQFVEDEKEQEEYLDKGIELLEKSLNFSRKAKSKFSVLGSLFFIDYFALFSGRINYLQKRILNDIKDCSELGKIYAHHILIIFIALWHIFYLRFIILILHKGVFLLRHNAKSMLKKGSNM